MIEPEHDCLMRWLRGNVLAVALCEDMTRILHLWDDLIDRDREPEPEEIHAAFQAALVDLPRNAFYASNFAFLNSLLVNAINQWHAANALESSGERHEQLVAFVIRSSYADLVTHCAYLIGGGLWARRVAIEVRKRNHSEGLERYFDALGKERRKE